MKRWRRRLRGVIGVAAAAALAGCVAVSDAPIRPEATAVPGPAFAVWYTGVGGFGDTDRRVIRQLTERGVPVAEINSRAYFWRQRTPREAAAALEKIVRRYEKAWPGRRLVVIGYSFGGAAVPMILPYAGPETRRLLRLVVLVAPSPKAQLVMYPLTLADIFDRNDPSTARWAAALWTPVLCVYGSRDRLAACPRIAKAEKVELPAGHLLKGQGPAVAASILRDLDRIAADAPAAPG